MMIKCFIVSLNYITLDPDSDTNPLSIPTLLLANISLPELGIGILIIVVLLFCTALIAASEVAFFSITPDKLTENDSELTPPVQRIMRIIKEPQYLLSTLLVSISFLSVGTVVVSSFVLETAYENFEYWLHQV
jgi:putative hemolysin